MMFLQFAYNIAHVIHTGGLVGNKFCRLYRSDGEHLFTVRAVLKLDNLVVTRENYFMLAHDRTAAYRMETDFRFLSLLLRLLQHYVFFVDLLPKFRQTFVLLIPLYYPLLMSSVFPITSLKPSFPILRDVIS